METAKLVRFAGHDMLELNREFSSNYYVKREALKQHKFCKIQGDDKWLWMLDNDKSIIYVRAQIVDDSITAEMVAEYWWNEIYSVIVEQGKRCYNGEFIEHHFIAEIKRYCINKSKEVMERNTFEYFEKEMAVLILLKKRLVQFQKLGY